MLYLTAPNQIEAYRAGYKNTCLLLIFNVILQIAVYFIASTAEPPNLELYPNIILLGTNQIPLKVFDYSHKIKSNMNYLLHFYLHLHLALVNPWGPIR